MSKHLLTKWYNGHMLYRNLPNPPQIWHVSGLTNRGGTVIPSNNSGVNGDIISLSYDLNPECQFAGYNITGATLTGNQFMINNSDVCASLSYYDRLAMTGKFCDKIVPRQGYQNNNESKFYVTTDGLERINQTVGYLSASVNSYGANSSDPTYPAGYTHLSIDSLNFNTARQVIFSASITATFNNPSGQWAVGDHTVTSWPGRGFIGLYGVDLNGNTLTLGSKTINMPGVGNYTAVLNASAYVRDPTVPYWGAVGRWNYMLSANSDLYGVDATPVATSGIWKIINKTV